MTIKLGIALSEADPWGFFTEIYKNFVNRYETAVFKPRNWSLPIFQTRVNRQLFYRDLRQFMYTQDVVFFEWASLLLATATQLPKSCNIVTRLHRYEMYQWADQINWEVVDRVILVSRAMEREFISRYPNQASKTVVSSPSTSLEKFTFSAKPFSGDIGILCHLTPRKRVYDLILTFQDLLVHHHKFHLHIAGGEHPAYQDYHKALHHLVRQLNLQDKVTFYGNVTEPWTWYPKIDIFISNSYSEGLQVAPMEAMASGCYCLSHFWDGADELVPPENLFFTDRELQEKILRYCDLSETEKQAHRVRMNEIAAEKFDIKKTVAQICQVVEQVGAHRNGSDG